MSRTRKLIINLLLIGIILSFFFTPLGFESKILLNRIFASAPKVLTAEKRQPIQDYNWKLKDENWDIFNFKRSEGRVVFLVFWASWRVPSLAELNGIQKLYDDYEGRVDFYIITNEEKAPVEELMKDRNYSFPVTYLIIGEKMPFDADEIPSGYILDKKGNVAAKRKGVGRWNSKKVRTLLNELISE